MNNATAINPERAWVYPEPGDDWTSIACRVLADRPLEQAVADLQSWNLYLAFRPAPAGMTCSDIVFIEAPRTR